MFVFLNMTYLLNMVMCGSIRLPVNDRNTGEDVETNLCSYT